ncbi:1-(5-phosphoribosyl)-5-[(5-phosphoribosylamino)methylideneamino]imidazole-4-carboxamide isomerase [Aureibacillus halotolerans]|uniref:1-(5-phosphoribosyl)-5-[(5-phosphoribosylamino)methylideneamino] imidazole-4-carboxamide isomerase n=1 Tax=Aureibacillus halotolerans TaxID=1508390 RepID=A0A4R6TXC2_9BACI|nr:1-(5-phosphoribosyl)-5-[(5-phosphoribosylamino)methylideneamino]imidazole-4-carboxamide isomerase [Aureibacillus halotolerans]TDQ36973.1 1-(5-phosphoribosyl)-5-[(5-phosphoribosylamino)methylideneamino] imidazole-4-carboxamide isomerase [Aureibacillus halotolerans]
MSTPFTIYPAIDILKGKCVRLYQGDYAKETVYGDSPAQMAGQFANAGASWVHMVDLDGAKEGKPVNNEAILAAAATSGAQVQVGGGIRTEEDIDMYLSGGVARVILGSIAVKDPVFTKKMLSKYGDQIVIGIDARNGLVATQGWLETSEVTAEELGKTLAEAGATTFIYTDISKDGTLTGPNTSGIVALAKETGVEVIASGGVSCLDDVKELQRFVSDGVGGVIIGKAIYDGRFKLEEALDVTAT